MILCKICNGPIQAGEPAIPYDDGLAHRFSTWCAWYAHAQRSAADAPGPAHAAAAPPTAEEGPEGVAGGRKLLEREGRA